MRLKTVVGGKSVERQAAASLKCMQTMARLQSEIRARRTLLLEENPSVHRQNGWIHDDDLDKSRGFVSFLAFKGCITKFLQEF